MYTILRLHVLPSVVCVHCMTINPTQYTLTHRLHAVLHARLGQYPGNGSLLSTAPDYDLLFIQSLQSLAFNR